MSEEPVGGGYVPIEQLDFFVDLERLCDEVWKFVERWPPFARDSMGLQLVRAIDSAGANMVEGDARFSDKESLHFFRIARGSAREAYFWLRRAKARNLLTEDTADDIIARFLSVCRRMNKLISTRRAKLDTVKEAAALYIAAPEPDEPDWLWP